MKSMKLKVSEVHKILHMRVMACPLKIMVEMVHTMMKKNKVKIVQRTKMMTSCRDKTRKALFKMGKMMKMRTKKT